MNNEEERSNNAKPSNPGADSDQTQAAKASGDGNWIGRVVSRCHSSGRKKQQCKSPVTQVVKASGDGSRIGCVVSCHHSSGGEEHAGLENGKKNLVGERRQTVRGPKAVWLWPDPTSSSVYSLHLVGMLCLFQIQEGSSNAVE